MTLDIAVLTSDKNRIFFEDYSTTEYNFVYTSDPMDFKDIETSCFGSIILFTPGVSSNKICLNVKNKKDISLISSFIEKLGRLRHSIRH